MTGKNQKTGKRAARRGYGPTQNGFVATDPKTFSKGFREAVLGHWFERNEDTYTEAHEQFNGVGVKMLGHLRENGVKAYTRWVNVCVAAARPVTK